MRIIRHNAHQRIILTYPSTQILTKKFTKLDKKAYHTNKPALDLKCRKIIIKRQHLRKSHKGPVSLLLKVVEHPLEVDRDGLQIFDFEL